MQEAIRAELRRLKSLTDVELNGETLPAIDGLSCRMKVLYRGEAVFFQCGPRAILIDVIAGKGVIGRRSIRKWDDGSSVTPVQRDAIVDRLADSFQRHGEKVIVVD
jgi:hypothetical protein